MVNKKITELTELTTPVSADVVAIVDDTIGTPTTKKITYGNIQSNLSITASQVNDFDTEVSNNSAVSANTSKVSNVTTNLSEGTSTETTVDVDSSDGTNATLVSASTLRAGVLTKAKFDEVVVNNAKVSYTDAAAVSSNTTHRGLTNDPHSVTATQVGLGNVSNVATDDTAYNATSWNTNTDSATKNAIRDKVETMDTAIGLNTSKVTNVSTNLSAGTLTATTIAVNSSDGTNATLVEADTTNAGILGSDKWDEIVANTTAKHTQGTDTALGAQSQNLDMNGNAITAITNIEYTGQSSSPIHTLTDQATITPDFDDGDVQTVTLTANRTLANPSNQKSGATYLIIVVQDAGGTNELTFGSNYKWSGGTAPTLSTDGDAVDILTFISDGTNMYGVFQGDFS